MKLPRRHFLHLAAGVAALSTVSHIVWALSSRSASATSCSTQTIGWP
jgi:hypothetical protein